MHTRLPRLAFACALALGLAASGAAQITVDSGDSVHPTVGEEVTITFDTAPESAQVVWRPNSAIPDTMDLGASGTSLTWTPDRAGVATIVTPDGTKNVSVRYTSLPVLGLFVLVGAGLILFGGAGMAMRALLSGDELPDMPLDT